MIRKRQDGKMTTVSWSARTSTPIEVHAHDAGELSGRVASWKQEFLPQLSASLGHDPAWLVILRESFKHKTFCLEATKNGVTVGLLPLSYLRSFVFGRFLVSLPYVNSAGILTGSQTVATSLIDRAVQLADQLDVRFMELRHETEHFHPALTGTLTGKVHMRLALPSTSDELWSSFKPKVRNQIRKGQRQGCSVEWGGVQQLAAFYDVFSRNMRDLGTPVYGRRLFANILRQFDEQAEVCIVRLRDQPIAGSILLHTGRCTEVPSASSLRRYNATNANMLMYWHLLQRAIHRGQEVFDFGRSSVHSNTFRFKKQWGAQPYPAVWQYYARKGHVQDMRPENGKYEQLIRIWRRLPIGVTRAVGPFIVRGIP